MDFNQNPSGRDGIFPQNAKKLTGLLAPGSNFSPWEIAAQVGNKESETGSELCIGKKTRENMQCAVDWAPGVSDCAVYLSCLDSGAKDGEEVQL